MNTQQIIDFVNQEINKGASKERIAQVLRINGVSQTEIDQALSGIAASAPPPPLRSSDLAEQAPMTRPVMPPPLTPPSPPPVMARPMMPPPPPPPMPMPTQTKTVPPMMNIPRSTTDIMPPRKSHLGLIIVTIFLLLLIGAGGASAYVYMYQPDLIKDIPIIGKLLNPTPTPEEAMAKMIENSVLTKSLSYNLNFTGSGTVPASAGSTDSSGSFSLQVKGKSDMNDPNNPKNESTITIEGKVNSGGMQISGDFGASALILDKIGYFKINRFPSFIPIPELSAITGQWIKIDPQAIASSSSTPEFAFSTFGNPAELGLTNQEMKALKSEILEAKPVQFGEFIGEEDLDEKKTYNYPITFSKPGLKKVLDIMSGLATKIENKMNEPMTATSTRNLAEGMTIIKSYIDDTDFPEGKIWIGQDDFLPYKIAFEDINVPIPNELKADLPNAKLNLSLVLEYSDYNQPVDIKAPSSFKTFDEIIEMMTPKMATSTKSLPTKKTTTIKTR